MESAALFPFALTALRSLERTPGDVVPAQAVDPATSDPPVPAAGSPTAREGLGDMALPRFFGGAIDPATPAVLRQRLSSHCDGIISTADRLAGQLPWNRDHADPLLADDPAVAWEPRRHQWLVRLAQAYALTGDWRYADACIAATEAWLDHTSALAGRDARMGRSSESDLAASAEAGARLMSWCWVLTLLRPGLPERLGGVPWGLPDPPIGVDDRPCHVSGTWMARVLAAMERDVTLVQCSLSYYCPPPTHLTGSALAVLYAGALFPESAAAAAGRDRAARLLIAQSEAQICADGVHFEQSTCFHAYTADVYLQFMLLAARNGIEVPPPVAQRVERMIEFLLAIRHPDGSIPSIGDTDGGQLLPLAPRRAADSRGRFALAAALFNREDFCWAAEGLAPEVAWLMGTEGVRRFDALRAAAPANAGSRVFPSGGYAVMRTGWERDAHQMIVDVGPLGCPVSSGHGHADILSLQCVVFGEACIADPGTHCYSGDSKWRDFFRSTAAHSAVVVDGVSQAETSGPFGWRRRPRVRLRQWHSTGDFDFVDAEHDGYTALPDPVVHRRRVIFVKPGYWIVVDDLSGKHRHQIDLTFQFATGDVRLEAHPWARAAMPGGSVLWISPFPSAPAQPALKCGEPSPTRGWISPEFARLSPAPMLIYSFAVALPWRIVTLLLPDRQGLSAPPAVRPLYDDGGLPHGIVFERPRRVVRFDDRAVLVERD